MVAGVLGERFGRHLTLDARETSALATLAASERELTRGQVVHDEHDPVREVFVVRRGWLFSSLLLPDGGRQIVSLHLPGEFVGDDALHATRAPFTLTSASGALLCGFDRVALGRVFAAHPRLAMVALAIAQAGRVALADRLASVGRTSAHARVAAVIVDVHRRLRAMGQHTAEGFVLPLTQEEIGDATGLTAVHVNRMMRQLADERLIARTGSRLTVLDEAALAHAGHHSDRLGALDTDWVPRSAGA